MQDFSSTLKCSTKKQWGRNSKILLQISLEIVVRYRDSSLKEFSLDARKLSNTKKELLLVELDKCDLLCSNCHKEHHNPEMLRTNGGNQSWNKESKYLSSEDCDRVFLYNLNTNNSKELDIKELEGKSTITFK